MYAHLCEHIIWIIKFSPNNRIHSHKTEIETLEILQNACLMNDYFIFLWTSYTKFMRRVSNKSFSAVQQLTVSWYVLSYLC